MQQINVLRSQNNMSQAECANDLKQIENDLNTVRTELAACKQSNQAILVTIEKTQTSNNTAVELQNRNA